MISIHALCEEGDQKATPTGQSRSNFYPRPLRGGRPAEQLGRTAFCMISIHALCEEGDIRWGILPLLRIISIHALCEEGDGQQRPDRGRQSISIHALCEEGDLAEKGIARTA